MPLPLSREPQSMHPKVDNTDWLKTVAIVSVAIDHFALYFTSSEQLQAWLEVSGRIAAPIFFFLIGYATSRAVPRRWLVLGAVLMVFDAWGDDWSWGPGSILFSFALFRLVRPALAKIAHASWLGSAALVSFVAVVGTVQFSSRILDTLLLYGAAGWLWSFLGLYHREYLDAPDRLKLRLNMLRWLVAVATVSVFWLQISTSYKEFKTLQLIILASAFSVLAACLLHFKRGESRWQPGPAGTAVLNFVGRHTLEIYAVQLMVSPIIAKLWPNLAG